MTTAGLWMRGSLGRRFGTFAATAAGVAIAVALVATLGSFLSFAASQMTARAAAGVAVDWQVQVNAGGDPATVAHDIRQAPGVKSALPVAFATTSGLTATTGGSTQTTGPGVVLGIPAGYPQTFPDEIRFLTGTRGGALIAQQTASNLHVAPGDSIQIGLSGAKPVTVRVGGVVDIPQANSLFQTVGAPPGSQPAAPPDNVLLLPPALFASVQAALSTTRPDLLTGQVHVALKRDLPADPASAFVQVTESAHNLEATLAGKGRVGDNLAAALDAARSDAAYASVLFLFLGLPGAILSGLLTFAIANAGTARRRRDQALLRARGASLKTVSRLVIIEALAVAFVGGVVGLAAAAVIGAVRFGSPGFGPNATAGAVWACVAFGVGLVIVLAAVLVPALRDFRRIVVRDARQQLPKSRTVWWERIGLDIVLLVVAAILIAITTQDGYSLVLAPEGVPTIQVNYWAFCGPALLWIGAGLLLWRLTALLLRHSSSTLSAVARPLAGNLASTTAATLSRQRGLFATATTVLALSLAFAASTAIFNTTYQQQAEVDARLTNGADVTVNQPPGSNVPPSAGAPLRAVQGVRSVEPLQHRFAYIGSDLQDLFGVNASSIAATSSLQNAYFQGGTAAGLMSELARTPDAILVSAETVKDYQLHAGDTIRLRLPNKKTGALATVPFRYVGVAKEFPTAPKDSFFVANASYIARMTQDDSVGAFLIDTGSADPVAVAKAVRPVAGPGTTVVPISAARSSVGSSLTSVDLGGLTQIEIAFAFVLAAGAGGVVFALGLAERRRTFAIAAVLGATRRQLRGMALFEAVTIAVGGLIGGALLGWAMSATLVAILTGVFDPPPDVLSVPTAELAALVLVAVAATTASALIAARRSSTPPIEALREA